MRFSLACGLLFAAAPVFAQAFSCSASASATPTVRARARAELLADVILDCNGLRPSGGLLAESITVTLNVPLTSRILNASLNASEALMLLEAPTPDIQVGRALGGADNPNANVFQGRQISPNAVQWNNVPLADQGTPGSVQRNLRITNLRADVSSLPTGGTVVATVTISSPSTIALNAAAQTVARVGAPLDFSVRTPDDLTTFLQQVNGCAGKPVTVNDDTPRDFNIRFSEGFASEFKRRNVATSLANPQAVGDQNAILGQLGYGTETGFFNSSFPTASAMNQAGLATQGTRLMARITGLPFGAQIWATTQPVIQGSSNTGITARMIQTDASGAGAFNAVGATAGIYAQLPVTNGAATVVWEVFNANQTILESLAFGFVVSIPANTVTLSTITITGSYAPHTTSASRTTSEPVPSFDGTQFSATPVMEVRPCIAQLTLSQACPLAPATIGLAYSVPLSAAGGQPPYRWSISPGALPPGLNVSTAGVISGTPTETGVYNFTLRVTDSLGNTATQECSMAVQAGVTITTACPLPDAAQGVVYAQVLAAAGGTPPYTWAVLRGTLPSGIQLARATGALSGASTSSGTFSFTLQASDSRGSVGQKDCSLRVVAPVRLSSTQLSFRLPAGAPRPSAQLLHLTSETPGQAWTARTSGDEWLRISPSSGRIPAVIEVSAAAAALAEGNYANLISITTEGAVPRTETVSVNLAVEPASAPSVAAQPEAVMLSLPRGTVREEALVQLTVRGASPAGYTAQLETETGGGWVVLPAVTGEATPQRPARIRIVFQPSALPAGTYRARLLIDVAGHGRLSVPIVLGITNSRESLSVSPSVVNLRAWAGAADSPSYRLSLVHSGQSPISFQTSVLTEPGQPRWLSVTPAAGRLNPGAATTLELRVNPAGLVAGGKYSGEFLVTAPGVDSSPRLVLVNLDVVSPQPLVFPESTGLVFLATPGGAPPPTQPVLLTNAGLNPITFDFDLAGDSSIWTITPPASLSIPSGATVRLDVAANPARVGVDVHTAQLNIQVAGDPEVKSVSLRLLTGGRSPAASTACPPGGLEVVSLRTLPGFSVEANSFLPVEVAVSDGAGAIPLRAIVTASINNGSLATLTNLGEGRWSGTVRTGPTSGPATLSILVDDGERGTAGCLDLPGRILPSSLPALADGGVLSSASFQLGAPLAPGGMAAIFGARLADGVTSSLALPLPQQLGITRARIGASRIPLFFAGDLGSFSQVNAILPYGLSPNVIHRLHVQTGAAIAATDVFITEAQPAVFTVNQRGDGQAIVVHGANPLLLADATNPIGRGQVIIIYCEGLGPVTPPSEAGRAAPADPVSRTAFPVRVTIGGQPAEVQFAGLTPGFTGLYQINAVVPTSVTPGNEVPLVVTVNGQSSPAVTLAVRP
jgi:uncharacterized protein (TIGR03437 family)